MKRITLLLLLIALAAASWSAVAGTAAHQGRPARLVIVSEDPLVVRGLGFRPRERVKLLVALAGRAVPIAAARASSAGRFIVRLRASVMPSEALAVQAIGSRGSRATVEISVPTGTLAASP